MERFAITLEKEFGDIYFFVGFIYVFPTMKAQYSTDKVFLYETKEEADLACEELSKLIDKKELAVVIPVNMPSL